MGVHASFSLRGIYATFYLKNSGLQERVLEIKFINHAGLIVYGNGVNLLIDPWTQGSSFNDGWDLLCASGDIDYKKLTHVWISHEHPDHFSVSDVKKVINEKPDVIFLFQSTKDNRVANFIQKLGGNIVSLSNNKPYQFNETDFIRVIQCGSIDSLSIIYIDGKTIVNMNDCVVGSELSKLKNAIENVKINCLLTQFGYASFISNPEDATARKTASKKKLTQMVEQISFFQPEFVIPFASYVYFSHVENFYMNDMQTDIAEVARVVEAQNVIPIILYPNDIFTFERVDNTTAIARYEDDRKKIKPIHNAVSVDFTEIELSAERYLNRLVKFHTRFGIYFVLLLSKLYRTFGKVPFDEVSIEISDLSKTVNFHILKGLRSYESSNSADIVLSSSSLKYALDYDWGWGTLMVNGRLGVKNKNARILGNRVFLLGSLRNQGISVIKDPFILLDRKNRINDLEVLDLFTEKKFR